MKAKIPDFYDSTPDGFILFYHLLNSLTQDDFLIGFSLDPEYFTSSPVSQVLNVLFPFFFPACVSYGV